MAPSPISRACLTERELLILAAAFSTLKDGDPAIDWARFAPLAGYASVNSARVCFRPVQKKLKVFIDSNYEGSTNKDSGTMVSQTLRSPKAPKRSSKARPGSGKKPRKCLQEGDINQEKPVGKKAELSKESPARPTFADMIYRNQEGKTPRQRMADSRPVRFHEHPDDITQLSRNAVTVDHTGVEMSERQLKTPFNMTEVEVGINEQSPPNWDSMTERSQQRDGSPVSGNVTTDNSNAKAYGSCYDTYAGAGRLEVGEA